MEHLLTSYLYANKICPLPTVGSLIIQPGAAVAELSEKRMIAPHPVIRFSSKEIDSDDLLKFIARQNDVDIPEASDKLSSYCNRLQHMQPYEEVALGSAGHFYITEDGQLHFKYNPVPEFFLPVVHAERVIHPEATHNMLVGDTQTNTGTMAEYLEEKEVVGRPKWVWAALGLFLVGTVLFLIYLLSKPGAGFLGNSNRIAPAPETATYNTSGNK